jgi:hypothetical protein
MVVLFQLGPQLAGAFGNTHAWRSVAQANRRKASGPPAGKLREAIAA